MPAQQQNLVSCWYYIHECLCVCRSVSDANLYTMTNRFTPATHAGYVSVTAMRLAASITRLWTRNPHDTTSAVAASASTVPIVQPETSATHAWRDISGRRDAVCTRETCAKRATVAATASPATRPCNVTGFELPSLPSALTVT